MNAVNKGNDLVDLVVQPEARGAGAVKACTTQTQQRTSKWVEALSAAANNCTSTNFKPVCEVFIKLRQETEQRCAAKFQARHKSAEEARARAHAQQSKTSVMLTSDTGQPIDPAAALRIMREGMQQNFFKMKKQSRLARWTDVNSKMAQAGVALNDSDTVRSGEVWLFGAANAVWPVVVVGAYRTFKNGLRPSVDQDQPLLLRATEAAACVQQEHFCYK